MATKKKAAAASNARKKRRVGRPRASAYEAAMREIERIESLREKAIEALLEERKAIDKKLRDLGHGTGAKRIRRRRQAPAITRFCNICQMEGHDGRAHRSQGKKKRKFTAEELQKLGLK